MVTDANHAIIARHDYTPFGEEIPAGYAGRGTEWGKYDAVNQKFTGKERDTETGLDYFGARYMSSAQGRFTSPDPSNLSVDFICRRHGIDIPMF
jgi:RHS repeat-associated protein